LSELKLISPLLDGFVMGAPISSHHGIRCCPAMKQDSDNKYIVKIISIPSSQAQLDALLLTGAYKDPGEAMDYFKELTNNIVKDAEFLQQLSKLDGFLSYENWQVVPMGDNQLGYLIYLVGSYKRSLDKHMRRSSVSHSDAIRLAIDMCTALSACRRAGSLYIDLKPSNIYLSEDKEARIGDLGFVPLDSVKYTSLPAKYRSPYTAPEAADPMQTLNETMDTYALGMILYQIYNNGSLPDGVSENIPAPANADPSLAEIILKAIHTDPVQRWQDPAQMGRAIIEYMQGSDPEKEETAQAVPQAGETAAPQTTSSDTQVFSTLEVNAALAEQEPQTSAAEAESIADQDTKVIPAAQISAVVAAVKAEDKISGDTKILDTEQIRSSIASDTKSDTKKVPVQAVRTQLADNGKDAVMAAAAVAISEKSHEAAVKTADTRVIPSVPSSSAQPKNHTAKKEAYGASRPQKTRPDEFKHVRKPVSKGLISLIAALLILGIIGYGAFYYYQNYYLQVIDSLIIEGEHNSLSVTVKTEIDESLLSVSCTDTYGNSMTRPLTQGRADFADLLPNSQYKINLEIEGFHQLVGKTSDVYNTESRTDIVSFTGITGAEDGSVMLSITVNGPEPDAWVVTYSAEGEEERSVTFSGHNVTVEDLAVSKLYTFNLSPAEEMYVSGQTTLDFMSTAIVMAQNLSITACDNNEMTVRWDIPENTDVGSWTVRCYGEDGYDQTIETSDNKAVFTGVNPVRPYHVEVTADGMIQPARTSITANPITISSFKVNADDPDQLSVTWDYKGAAPDGGWLLMYSLDGTNTQSVVKCENASAAISPQIFGAEYRFVIQAADSTSIFSNIYTYQCPNAEIFTDHSFDANKLVAYLLPTPEKEGWTTADLSKEDYTDTFTLGQNISVVFYCPARFYIPEDPISVLYVLRNSQGQVITKLITKDTLDWHDLWVHYNVNYGEFDLPVMPDETGEYTISIYFNGKAMTSTTFTVTD